MSTLNAAPDNVAATPANGARRVDLDAAAVLWRTLARDVPPRCGFVVTRSRRLPDGKTGPTEYVDEVTTEGEYLDAVTRADSDDSVAAVYVSVDPLDLDRLAERRARRKGARGSAAEVGATVAVVADLDAAHGRHKTTKTLPTAEQLPQLLDGLPTPSLVVDTGGGWHVWWALSQPLTDTVTAKRARAAVRQVLKRNADTLGVHVDLGVTTDAARILRVPGTWNRKGDPVPVRIVTEGVAVEVRDLLSLDAAIETDAALADPAAPAPLPRATASEVWDTFTGPGTSGQWISDAVEDFTRRTTWGQVLTGWEEVGQDAEGTHFRRPGQTDNYKSATVYRDTDRLTVWSESTDFGEPTDASGRHRTFDKVDAAAVTVLRAPLTPANRVEVLRRAGYGPTGENRGPVTHGEPLTHTGEGDDMHRDRGSAYDDDRADSEPEAPSTWSPVDLGPFLDGTYVPPTPTLLPRTDGVRLLYPGLVHSLHGESESGKSLIMQAEITRAITAGLPVLMLDFESDPGEVTGRLLTMGATPTDIRAHFTYVRPEVSPSTGPDLDAYREVLGKPYALVVVDGLTDALSVWTNGTASSSDNDALASFMRRFPRRLARKTGAAVVLIDHVTKDADTRGRFAIGGQAKMNALDGAAYTVEVSQVPTVGARGVLVLRVGKDRPGQVRRHCGPFRKSDRTQEAARIVVDSTGPVTVLTVDPWHDSTTDDDSGDFRPTAIMEKVSRAVEGAGEPLTGRDIRDMVAGRVDYVNRATRLLVAEGFLARATGKGNAHLHTLTRPYRQTEDPRSDRYVGATPGTGSGSPGTGNHSPSGEDPNRSGSGSRSKDRGTGNHSLSGVSAGSGNHSGTTREPLDGPVIYDPENPWGDPVELDPVPVHACAGTACQTLGCQDGGK
jgi:hypothetical protein